MKRQRLVRKIMLTMATGGVLLQTATCADQAQIVTAVTSTFTAGGLFILLRRILTE